MQTLYIDTHNTLNFSIGYFDGNSLLIEEGRDASSEMIQKIDCLTSNQIDEIIFIKGPGSLTGIRIGASFAQGISLAKKISVKSFSIFDLILKFNPDIEIFFYTGTKKWIKKNKKAELILTDLPDSSSTWTSNNPNFFSTLDLTKFIPFPNLIELMHTHKKFASHNNDILYPVTMF